MLYAPHHMCICDVRSFCVCMCVWWKYLGLCLHTFAVWCAIPHSIMDIIDFYLLSDGADANVRLNRPPLVRWEPIWVFGLKAAARLLDNDYTTVGNQQQQQSRSSNHTAHTHTHLLFLSCVSALAFTCAQTHTHIHTSSLVSKA